MTNGNNEKRKREAERRQTQFDFHYPRHASECCHSLSASGAARLSAFHHGSRLGDERHPGSPNGGLIVTANAAAMLAGYKLIIALAAQFKLPTIYPFPNMAIEGGLMSPSPNV